MKYFGSELKLKEWFELITSPSEEVMGSKGGEEKTQHSSFLSQVVSKPEGS